MQSLDIKFWFCMIFLKTDHCGGWGGLNGHSMSGGSYDSACKIGSLSLSLSHSLTHTQTHFFQQSCIFLQLPRSHFFYFFIRLPPEFFPVSGLTERWCASTLGAALLCSSRAGSDLGLVSRLVWGLCQLGSSSQVGTCCGLWRGNSIFLWQYYSGSILVPYKYMPWVRFKPGTLASVSTWIWNMTT